MAINKVQYFGDTLIDLTSDTVTADTLIQGYTAHDKSGAAIEGTLSDATQSASGLMSASDKKKLDGIATGAEVNVIEGVTVNGTAATITNKIAALSIDLSAYWTSTTGESNTLEAATVDEINAILNA